MQTCGLGRAMRRLAPVPAMGAGSSLARPKALAPEAQLRIGIHVSCEAVFTIATLCRKRMRPTTISAEDPLWAQHEDHDDRGLWDDSWACWANGRTRGCLGAVLVAAPPACVCPPRHSRRRAGCLNPGRDGGRVWLGLEPSTWRGPCFHWRRWRPPWSPYARSACESNKARRT